MNGLIENILLVSSVLGFLLSIALISHIARQDKANFFLGLIVWLMALELLFSWGSYSGYNQSPDAFPFWIFLTYHIIPPSIWLFVSCSFDPTFQLKRWHTLLFFPALAEIAIHVFSRLDISLFRGNLMDYHAWVWFIDYIPLAGFILLMGYFWTRYFKAYRLNEFKPDESGRMPHVKLLFIMGVLSLICLLWMIFTFIGWTYYSAIELSLVFLFFVISFLIFLDSRPFPAIQKMSKGDLFSNYDDQQQLKRLNSILKEKQLFARPGLSLKELSRELNLPSRYLSYLINRYHRKNFNEFINEHRIDAFITRAKSAEARHKTLLAIAFESGFNSKSSFNQVFKDHKGKPPSDYLNQN